MTIPSLTLVRQIAPQPVVADMHLAAGEGVYFTHHVLLRKDPEVTMRAMSLKGGWKQLWRVEGHESTLLYGYFGVSR